MTSIDASTKTPSVNKSSVFLRLMNYAKAYGGQVILILSLILLVNLTTLLKPWFIQVMTDEYIAPKSYVSSFGLSIPLMAFLYVLIYSLGMLGLYWQTILITRLGTSVSQTMREALFSTILYSPIAYLDQTSSGRLITRTTNDVEAVTELFTDIMVSLVKDVVLLVGIFVAMARMNVTLTLWAGLVIPPMMLMIFYVRKLLHDNWVQLKAVISKINGFIAENISGMKIVQIFGGEEIKQKQFEVLNQEYFDRSLLQLRLHSFSGPSANIFESIATALILTVGMRLLNNGQVHLGVILGMTLYVRQFFAPLAELAESFTQIESAMVSSSRIFEILDLADQTEDLKKGQGLAKMKGKVVFDHVWFAYEGENWVLKDVSFTINPGETFAIIGETGSGKTTIISLLSNFYDIQKGRITIDGIDIATMKKEDLRRQVAVVLQDVFLFSGDIRGNITLEDEIPEERIASAVAESQSTVLLNHFEDGLDHEVMERGATLSMGQRQLISFARALAHDPAIFVLDEATANIDTKTEELITTAIQKIAKDRTTIIIAHRLSTIRQADCIMVLAKGEILEMGNHQELMAKDSTYKFMVEKGSKLTEDEE